ncbi:MAG: glycosyltransferase family 4 protein [Halioglobus sp.]|nr:glycosyltransferase family 4 protein [Halioglobus sp.]
MKDTPRIGYVLKTYPRISQTFVLTEILAHERAGLDMDIFSLRRTDDTRFHAALSRVKSPVFQIARASTRVNNVLDELREHARHLPRLWQVLEESGAEAEDLLQAAQISRAILDRGIVHLHAHFGTVATAVARLASQITGVSYSFTAHAKDIYHELVVEDDLRQKIADAAQVVTVSEFNATHLRATFGSAAQEVKLVYNGLDLNEFCFEPYTDRPPVILGVGRLVEKKGFEVLVRACEILRDRGVRYRCEIAGGGVLEQELKSQIVGLGLQGHIVMSGALAQEDIKDRIRGAALLAAPCIHARDEDRDGLPTILLEAMALGTPCISTPVTGIPEVLRHDETGLMVAEGDAEALANACQRLLEDRQLGSTLVHYARKLIEQRFDIDKNSAQLRAAFGTVTAQQTYRGNAANDCLRPSLASGVMA